MTRRMNLPPEPTLTRIEQALAFGYSDQWIRDRHHVTDAAINAVRTHLDDVNQQEDADVDKCRKGIHELSPDAIYTRADGRQGCRPCKQARDARRRAVRQMEAVA